MSAQQIGVFERLGNDRAFTSSWRDWKWQLRHAVTDITGFERLLQIKFSDVQRRKFERTIGKFPLSITPYYLSLIDIENIESLIGHTIALTPSDNERLSRREVE